MSCVFNLILSVYFNQDFAIRSILIVGIMLIYSKKIQIHISRINLIPSKIESICFIFLLIFQKILIFS